MKRIIAILAAAAIMSTLAACSQKKTESPETAPTESISVPQTTQPEQVILPEADFSQLEALLGAEDAPDALGGGQENWTSDRSTFIGRIYQVSLLGSPVNVYTSCDSDNRVSSVSIWITDGNETVTEEQILSWAEQVQDYAGSQPIYDDTTSEAGSRNWKWEKDGVFITLRALGDILTVDLVPAVGELK